MKTIAIIGIGMNAETITIEAQNEIQKAEILMGAKRMVESFAHLGKKCYVAYQPDIITAVVEMSQEQNFVVLVSGDVGFYSGATALYESLGAYEIKLIPGISTVSCFFAKCGLPWQTANIVSCHGTDLDIVGEVRRNRLTFALTGGNIDEIADALCKVGFGDLSVCVGERLGLPGENISKVTVAELKKKEYSSLTVLLIKNAYFDSRVRTGIPDTEFKRSQIPMTKAEVRAVCLSKLALQPTDICYDVGCGTGSVTVEMGLSSYRGHVYAIDKKFGALALTKENCIAFHVNHVTMVAGIAPEVLSALPPPDAVFIGGSSGKMSDIVEALLTKNPHVRIVITAITIESVSAAIHALEQRGIVPEIVQLSVAQAKEVGGLHLMQAQNPIFIVSGGAHE